MLDETLEYLENEKVKFKDFCDVSVVVQFCPWFNFYFPLFFFYVNIIMIMNRKQKKIKM